MSMRCAPRFALDVGTFIMADAATRHYGSMDLASELRARSPSPRVANFESGTLAKLVGPVFDKIAANLVDAFVKRAQQVYGD